MIYELHLQGKEKVDFKLACWKKMDELEMTKKQLAEKTGYSVKSIYTFFSNDKIKNRFLAATIAEVLQIKSEDYINE